MLFSSKKTSFSRFLISLFFMAYACMAHSVNLTHVIQTQEQKIQGEIGVGLWLMKDQSVWQYKGDEMFPMTSTFKTLLCARMLEKYDNGLIDLSQQIDILPTDILDYAPVSKKLVNQSFSLSKACQASLQTSDNTAANLVLAQLGGPKDITEFTKSLGALDTRLDRIEPMLNQVDALDERDTTTPTSMLLLMRKIIFGDVLSEISKQQLIVWMKQNQVADPLMRSVLPQGWQIADRSGAGSFGARGFTAAIWPDNDFPFILVIYIKQTSASLETRNQVIAKISQAVIEFIQTEKKQVVLL